MVSSWSHSKLVDFEKCKHLFWLKHDRRIPEPERELKPGQTEHANDRGTRVHEDCEAFVRGDQDDLCIEADKHFGMRIMLLREMHKDGLVSVEGEWGYNREWEPDDWKTAWLRMKLDAIVHHSDTHATVIDYKTGKKWGNEVKHGEQLQLYQLATFLRYPKLESVTAELWYLDQNEVTSLTFTRTQGLRFRANFDRRGNAATMCEVFPPNPNKYSCQWCPYKGTEHCSVGV